MKGFFRIPVFILCAALLLFSCPAVARGAGEDGKIEGLWLRVPDFPDDAEVIEFSDDGEGEVTYIRAVDGGLFVLGIHRSPAGEGMDEEMIKEAIAEGVKERGGDPADIEFDSGAEEFSELLSYPCVTAEYEIGENEDARHIAILAVFTDEYVFLLQADAAADSMDDYSDRSRMWLGHMKFVGGDDRGGLFNEEEDEEEDEEGIPFVAAVYSLPGFRGVAWQIPGPGSYDLGNGFDMPNDSICSIGVCPGYKVTLFQHSEFGGGSAEFVEGRDDLGEMNRQASSLKVELVEEPDPGMALEWFMVHAENEGLYEEIDFDVASTAKALKTHSKRIRRFQGAAEPDWYGATTGDERIRLGGELIKIFSDLGVDTGDFDGNTFAQAMNNFYDWRKDLSVWDSACMLLNVNPEDFK